MRKVLFFFLLYFSVTNSWADQGCLISDRMYTSYGLNILAEPIFTTSTYLDGNGKCWAGASGTCKVCDGVISVSIGGVLVCLGDLFGPRTGGVYSGQYFSSFAIVDCPIDNFVPAIAIFSGIIGMFKIRKTHIFHKR